MTYKELIKECNLTDADIAKMFSYKTANGFNCSARKDKVREGVKQLILHIKKGSNQLPSKPNIQN